MFLKPKAGLTVIDPSSGKPLPLEGKTVTRDLTYWQRRLKDGDVVTETQPKPAKGK